MKKWIIFGVAVVVVFIAAGIYLDQKAKEISKVYGPGFIDQVANQMKDNITGKVTFGDYGKAPEFSGISHWLNSDPQTMASLKGKVVLVDFWTYSCINCIRTLPYVTKWYDTYKDKGFVIVGVHTPEFAFEKETKNVQDAISHFGIHYPVAQDNEYTTWNAFSNQYWPAEYLIDQKGEIVYTHFGEGNYDHTENAIRELLGLNEENMPVASDNLNKVGSPEMYFGTSHNGTDHDLGTNEAIAGGEYMAPEQKIYTAAHQYTFPQNLSLNHFAFDGSWKFTPETVVLTGDSGSIRLKFHSGKVHLVASSANPATLKISVDGKAQPEVTVQESQLYTLFDSNEYTDHVIDISVMGKGFEAFTFTFG